MYNSGLCTIRGCANSGLSQFGVEPIRGGARLPNSGSCPFRQLFLSVCRCYFAIKPRVFTTVNYYCRLPQKDALSAFQLSSIVYQYLCHCGSRFVGRTIQVLSDRIKQLVPKCSALASFLKINLHFTFLQIYQSFCLPCLCH